MRAAKSATIARGLAPASRARRSRKKLAGLLPPVVAGDLGLTRVNPIKWSWTPSTVGFPPFIGHPSRGPPGNPDEVGRPTRGGDTPGPASGQPQPAGGGGSFVRGFRGIGMDEAKEE